MRIYIYIYIYRYIGIDIIVCYIISYCIMLYHMILDYGLLQQELFASPGGGMVARMLRMTGSALTYVSLSLSLSRSLSLSIYIYM